MLARSSRRALIWMLLHARRTCASAERRQLDEFLHLHRAERTETDVAWLAALMERCGSVAYARTFAQGMAGAAIHEFALAYGDLPESRDKAFLASLVPWVFDRP